MSDTEHPVTSDQPITIAGPVGDLEGLLRQPAEPRFAAIVAHPHPLYGGTMHNAVVEQTSSRLAAAGAVVLRFNFRGVGQSAGEHDNGRGEVLDLAAVEQEMRERFSELELWLAGYSFGAVCTLRRLSGEPPNAATRARAALLLAPPLTHYDFSTLTANAIPLAVIVGGNDDLTPADQLESQVAQWGAVVHQECLDGAGHDLLSFSQPRSLGDALDRALKALAQTEGVR